MKLRRRRLLHPERVYYTAAKGKKKVGKTIPSGDRRGDLVAGLWQRRMKVLASLAGRIAVEEMSLWCAGEGVVAGRMSLCAEHGEGKSSPARARMACVNGNHTCAKRSSLVQQPYQFIFAICTIIESTIKDSPSPAIAPNVHICTSSPRLHLQGAIQCALHRAARGAVATPPRLKGNVATWGHTKRG